jgi:TIR domain
MTWVRSRKLAALGFEIMATSRRSDPVPQEGDAGTTSAASGRIFICYRREDSGYPAGWLFDQLAAHFGVDRVFKDVDSIEPGDDFAAVISEAVESCAVLLAVIGDAGSPSPTSTAAAWMILTISYGWRSRRLWPEACA